MEKSVEMENAWLRLRFSRPAVAAQVPGGSVKPQFSGEPHMGSDVMPSSGSHVAFLEVHAPREASCQSGLLLSCIITSYLDKGVVLGSCELNPFQSSPIPIVTKK